MWKTKLIKRVLKLVVFCLIIGILSVVGVCAYFAKDLPDPTRTNQNQIESTKIFDRTGKILLYDIHGEEKRTVIPFEEMPQIVKDATIVIEDDNFYHHFGLDFRGIIRAAITNFQGDKISQGGSTITQQYIKNAYLGGPQSQRTYARKIKEAILSFLLESKYSKDEILGFYLNQIPYGSNAYGIEAASQTFFNKRAKDLTLAEATLLAALPQAPTYYSPYGSHPDELKARQEYILERMVKLGYISEEQSQQAKEEELDFSSQSNLKAHHFVTMIREYLEEKYSRLYSDINTAGLKVYTTLDWDLQQIAEDIVSEEAEKNYKNFRAANAALVAIDPKTGQLLALVGSKDYTEQQFNVATSPYRQPGSSFKPFAYAAAFEKGFTPETILFDLETSFGEFGPAGQEKEYIPKNYDLKFRGPVTMRQALAQSLNLPSVKTLYLAGIDDTIKLAQDMGITTLKDRKSYGLSLVLGGGEVKLLDETAAYSVFATEGIKHPLSIALKIEDANGNVLEEYKDDPTRVLDEQIARQITSILSDEQARAPVMGSHSNLYLPGRPAAAKTGTTQDYSDGWTIGYTPSLVVGAWAGNNEFSKKMRQGAAGLYVAAPIWNKFMTEAYKIKTEKEDDENNKEEEIENQFTLSEKVEYFIEPTPTPSGLKHILSGEFALTEKVKVNRNTGKLVAESTPIGLIVERAYKQIHSVLYYVDKDNPQGENPNNPSQDEQFQNWESSVLNWIRTIPCTESPCPVYNQNPPTEYDTLGDLTEQEKADLQAEISSPKTNTLIEETTLIINTQASTDIQQVDFFFDNELIGSDSAYPFSITVDISPYKSPHNANLSEHLIKIQAYDKLFNQKTDQITVYLKENN